MPRLKKIYVLFLTSILLCSCGKSDPIASNKALTNTEKAIEIGDNYIKGDLSSDDAKDQLEDILSNLQYADEYSFEEKIADPTKYADYYLQFYISSLNIHILIDGNRSISDADTFDNVIESLDKLKEEYDKYD
jgi:polyhydroxyalkanoate synthesis regulator phasin